MDLRIFARGAAILQSIRSIFPNEPLPLELEIFQAVDDMEQYYAQLPHLSLWHTLGTPRTWQGD